MKNLFYTLLILCMSAFSTKACEIYVEFDPNWSCEDLEVCWVDNSTQTCVTVVEGDIFDVPENTVLSFTTNNCTTNTFFNIFDGASDILLADVNITGPNIEWTWSTNCANLPVEIISFQVKQQEKEVKLNWLLGMQENLALINIYRNDEKIAVVINEDTEQLAWSFTDTNPNSGVNYYRLQFVDHDGTYEYSELKAIMYATYQIRKMNRTVSNTHTFEIWSENPFDYTVSVTSLNGQLISSTRWQGNNQGEITVDTPSSGYYLISMNDGYTIETFKVISQ